MSEPDKIWPSDHVTDNNKLVETGVIVDLNPVDLNASNLNQRRVRENLEEFEHLFGVDEDAYDQPTTSRRELWAYYLYYNGLHSLSFFLKHHILPLFFGTEYWEGDNGVGPGSYSQALYVLPICGTSDGGRLTT
jgi:hypothetical protein